MSLTLQEYIKNLQDLIDNEPDLALAEVWAAKDDEGNGYQAISFTPSLRLIERTETYSVEDVRNIEEEFDDLAAELGLYKEDFDNHESYRKEASDEINKQFKQVIIVN